MTSSLHHGDDDTVQARGVASRHLHLVVPHNAAVRGDGDGGLSIRRSPDDSADDQPLTILAW
jgi:hypothetical protein